jgi:N6-adenosine-specific RNA methylase IME4
MPDEFRVDAVGMELLTKFPRKHFGTILADPPWRFMNRTGKMAPEHKRLSRYGTMSNEEIMDLPVAQLAAPQAHLYLWVPNALIREGLEVMKRWGFQYKTNIVWFKVRKDGGPDGRGVGFYFRNVTELVLFGIRGKLRTGSAGRRQTNIIIEQKRAHSIKPDALFDIIETCSPGPYIELFARFKRKNWSHWGDEATLNGEQIKMHPMYNGNGIHNGTKRRGKKQSAEALFS